MDKMKLKKEGYYYQCVMEANREANYPFSVYEIDDYVKVKSNTDLNGVSLIRGMAYQIINIKDNLLELKPLNYQEQIEFMHMHVLEDLLTSDFEGNRLVMKEDTILFKRVNVEKYMDFLVIQKRAYGIVNSDACFEANKFVTDEV